MSVHVYAATVHKENGVYGAIFPDLPGCVTVGDSQTELALNASEALALHLEGLLDEGESLPDARNIEDLQMEPNDIAVILVTAYASKSKEAA